MRKPWIDAKGFRGFHWTRGISSRRVMEAHQGKRYCVYVEKERKRKRKGEEFLSSYVCKNQAWEECV
jgi:hypothetical protein